MREAPFDLACTSSEGFRMTERNTNTDTHKHIQTYLSKTSDKAWLFDSVSWNSKHVQMLKHGWVPLSNQLIQL
jgi:hypothetical protein